MRKSLLLPVVLFSLSAQGQTIRTGGSFIYTQLTAYSNEFTDAFSFGGNTGALAATQKLSAGVFSERRFGLKELSAHAAAFVLPTASGNFGLQGTYFGNTLYNEASVGLAYARNLGSKVALGLQFNYFGQKAAGYGGGSTVTADAGLVVRLAPQLTAGVQACNPAGSSLNKNSEERLPAIYRAGLGFEASKQFFVSAEAEKVENGLLGINAGMQYILAEKIVARAGVRSATEVYYMGFGVQMKSFRFDVTASVHPYLGLTPGLLLLYTAAK